MAKQKTPVIIAVLWLLAASVYGGGAVTAIHSFSPTGPNGSSPYTPLTPGADGNFYGTASQGGVYGWGTVYKVTPTGVLTAIYSFTLGNDGGMPRGGLVEWTNGSFYGTTQSGGSYNNGVVYCITPDGVLTPLHSFASVTDGAAPLAGMVLATDGNFYGTTTQGGAHSDGTIYQVTPPGAFKNIYSFKGQSDGAVPLAPLVQGTDGELYGTTEGGGNIALNEGYGYGAIFKITTAGNLTPLYAFTDGNDGETPYSGLVEGLDGNFYGTSVHGTTGYGVIYQVTPLGGFNVLHQFEGEDGAGPLGALIQADDTNLYGTTLGGGTNDAGTVFQISTKGAFTSLYSFVNLSGTIVSQGGPFAGLMQGANGILYGTTLGGSYAFGSVFSITTNGAFASVCSFPGGNGDGAEPAAGLLQDTNGILYGTAVDGGTNGDGTIFQITTAGVLTPIYSFTGRADGGNPRGGLTQGSDGNVYGTTGNFSDGPNTNPSPDGTVFKMTTNGAVVTLYSFTNGSDGVSPHAGLVEGPDGNFYGTTTFSFSDSGTLLGDGTIFRLTPAGIFTNLHSFNGGSDGGSPDAPLLLASDGNFYGTASGGGNSGHGTIFKITTNGVFSVIYELAGNNGAAPYAPLIQGRDGSLYGTCSDGGASFGTIFKITLPNTFTLVYTFTNGIDGADPIGALVQGNDGNFYGTTSAGGQNGTGAIFLLTSSGIFQPLYSFSAFNQGIYNQSGDEFNQDGVGPSSSLTQAGDGNFYGVTQFGGQYGTGTIFRLSVTAPSPPEFLSAIIAGGILNLTWSSQAGNLYQLQYCTNLAEPVWNNLGVSQTATALTLSGADIDPAGGQRFYRLIGLP